jgi:hypothetical protein
MSEINSDNNEETPVDFLSERDILGLAKPEPFTETSIKEKVADLNINKEKNPDTPFSEYQPLSNFFLLNILSLGFYQLYWFYKHWRFLRDNKELNIQPAMRALFTIFFGYSLFSRFYILAKEKGYKEQPLVGLLFILFIATGLLAYLDDPYLTLISLFSFVFLIPVHQMMNFYYLEEQPGYRKRIKFSSREKNFLIVFWGIILFLAIAW